MKTLIKYLIVGWSIVTISIIIISYQIMKEEFIQEDYFISFPLKNPEKISDKITLIAEGLFGRDKDGYPTVLTKKEFVEKIKKAKGVTIESQNKVKNKLIFLFLPLYSFTVWAVPILIFSLIGILFGKNKGDTASV